jgi:hypothetical protein
LSISSLLLLSNGLLYLYLTQERTVYSWDFSIYEFKFIEAVRNIRIGLQPLLTSLLGSIHNSDSNQIVPTLISPIGLFLEPTRPVYLFTILNLLAFPALAVLGWVFVRMLGPNRSILWALLPSLVALLNPYFWIPLLQGYYDISLWIVLLVVWHCMAREDGRPNHPSPMATGVLLSLLPLLRRWAGFWAAGFLEAVALLWLLARLRSREPYRDLRWIAQCGLCAFAIIILTTNWWANGISVKFYDSFQAYKFGMSSPSLFLRALSDHGWITCAFAAMGAAWAAREPLLRGFVALSLLQSFLALIHFSSVQVVAPHQQTLFTLFLVLLQSFFAWFLWASKWKTGVKWALTGFFTLNLLVNFMQPLFPRASLELKWGRLWAEARHPPQKRGDLDEIQRLIRYLGSLPSTSGSIYVLASSTALNSGTFQNAGHYLGFADNGLCSRIYSTFDLDLRDGFPWPLFRADYVLVAEPIQCMLPENHQLVVSAPAAQMLSGQGIGRAFRRLPEGFQFDGGITVRVFQRVGKIRLEDIRALNRIFLAGHPNRPDLFGPSIVDDLAQPARVPGK